MKKHYRSVYVVLSVGVAVGLLTLAGCKKTASEKRAENMMARALEKATGGKADVDISRGKVKIKDSGGEGEIEYGAAKWPDDLPEVAVKFEGGKIKGVTRSTRPDGKGWMVMLENVEAKAVNAYVETLKGEGWSIPSNMTAGRGGMFQAEKEKIYLVGMFNGEEKILSLSFVLKNEE